MPGAVAQAGRDDLLVLAVRIEGQHVGAPFFGVPGGAERLAPSSRPPARPWQRRREHVERDVGARADREEHRLPSGENDDVARPVMASTGCARRSAPARRTLSGRRSCSGSAPRCRVGDIDPLRVGTGRIERDAIGLVEAGREDLAPALAWRCPPARDRRAPGWSAVGDEQVAVRRDADDARASSAPEATISTVEAGRNLRHRALRHRRLLAEILDVLADAGAGPEGEQALEAGLSCCQPPNGGLSFQHVVLSGSANRNGGAAQRRARKRGCGAWGAPSGSGLTATRRRGAGSQPVARRIDARRGARGTLLRMSTAPHFPVDLQDFWRDPYPALAEMRREAPIAFVPQLGARC